MDRGFQFSCVRFDELSLQDLYDIMALRQEVFVVEQDCPYLDADGKDQAGWHITGYNSDGCLVMYARLLPKGIAYADYPSIGRVITAASVRGSGLGKTLMTYAIECAEALTPGRIKISAQSHLEKFYGSLGFQQCGPGYLEDDIPHIPMLLSSDQDTAEKA